jgi:hypothetical protein
MTIDGTVIAIGITVARTMAVVELDPATTIKLLQHQLICVPIGTPLLDGPE